MTLVPWKVGRCPMWDVTCPDTLASSHRAQTSVTRYAVFKATHEFVPVAIETLNEEGTSFLCEISEQIKDVSGDPRETAFLF